jgi:beta-lactamase class A
VASLAKEAIADFGEKGLTQDGLSVSLIDLSSSPFLTGTYRGDVPYYPASVVKVFYLSYYEVEKEARHLANTPELVRAVRDMITVSSNDATGFVVDSITGTTSGPELSGRDWETWKDRRNAINRFFAKRGYNDLNANQKTFCEDAYGRERAFRDGGRNTNRMTTDLAARLFAEIANGEITGPAGQEEMWRLLSRDVTSEKPVEEEELENARLAGHPLPPGTAFWAKSGDAYDVRHLVARVQIPGGAEFVLAVFTKGVKNVPAVIPRVFERVAARYAVAAKAP